MRIIFGIGESKEYTVEEVSAFFQVDIEDVLQITAKELRKLRHTKRAEILKKFIPDFDNEN